MSSQVVQQFADAAEQFCAWAEGPPQPSESDAMLALQLLSNLYQQALHLPSLFGEQEPDEVTHDAWKIVYHRFGSLPFNYYMQCTDPSNVPGELPGVADLADDLADIWRDLKRGLLLHKAGHASAACWEWRQGFWQHWGNHASGGIYALHNWHARHQQSAT